MNQIQAQLVCIENGEAVTTTLAIAEGCEVDHASIIKLVRNYANDLEEFGILDFKSENQTGNAGRPTEFAILNEQQATLIMTYMRNSEIVRTFKKRLVKAFYELALNKHSDPYAVLNDPAAMRGLLLNYAEKVEQRDKLIADIAPKAAIADKLLIADGLYNLTHAAKLLNIPPRKFNQELHSRNWIYRMGVIGPWTGRAEKVKAGYLDHKLNDYVKNDGTIGTNPQVMITAKGIHRLAEIFNVELDEAA